MDHNGAVSPKSLPPGLTCNQYYLYLSSGYTYSFTHRIMYNPSQVAPAHQSMSETWISNTIHPFRLEDTRLWLASRHYYDFVHGRWMPAEFCKPAHVMERIWQEEQSSQYLYERVQQKAEDVAEMMAGMSLNTSTATKKTTTEGRARRGGISTARNGKGYSKVGGLGLKISEGKIKTRRASRVKDKMKTLPPSMALNPGFWKTVM
jgi:hypothetical protein